MMKICVLTWVLVASTVGGISIPDFKQKISSFITETAACTGTIGSTTSIVFEGETVFAGGFGVRDADQNTPVMNTTLFSIASTTKAFTGMLAAMLVDEGVLSLDELVTQYRPEFQLHDQCPTLMLTTTDLLSHRSGLPAGSHDLLTLIAGPNGLPVEYRDQLISGMKTMTTTPSNSFRQQQTYNNYNYLLAGALIAEQGGYDSWESALQTLLLTPLGMDRTFTDAYEAVTAVNDDVSKPAHFAFTDLNVQKVMGPSGSILSNGLDMASWLHFLLNKGVTQEGHRLVSEAALDLCFEPLIQLPAYETQQRIPGKFFGLWAYGLGWNIGAYGTNRMFSHTGGSIAHGSSVLLFPDQRFGFYSSASPQPTTSVLDFVALYAFDLLSGATPSFNATSACELLNPVTKKTTVAKKTTPDGPTTKRAYSTDDAFIQQVIGTWSNDLYQPVVISRSSDGLSMDLRLHSLYGRLVAADDSGLAFDLELIDDGSDGHRFVQSVFDFFQTYAGVSVGQRFAVFILGNSGYELTLPGLDAQDTPVLTMSTQPADLPSWYWVLYMSGVIVVIGAVVVVWRFRQNKRAHNNLQAALINP